jgi:hypothetical protein
MKGSKLRNNAHPTDKSLLLVRIPRKRMAKCSISAYFAETKSLHRVNTKSDSCAIFSHHLSARPCCDP